MKLKRILIVALTIWLILFCFSGCKGAENAMSESTVSGDSLQGSSSTDPTESEAHIHDFEDATCLTPQRCRLCGEVFGEALGHDFSEATCTEPATCIRCGLTDGTPLGHDFVEATCEKPTFCTRCGETQGDPLGHDYSLDGDYGAKLCARCGKTDPDTMPTALNDLFLVDSQYFSYQEGSFTDSYGNQYSEVYYFTDLYQSGNNRAPHAIYNLNGEYTQFFGSIVAGTKTNAKWTYYVNIYADDELVFHQGGLSKTSARIDFSVDVSGCVLLKIVMGNEGTMGDTYMELGIVEAYLQRQ